MQHLRELVALQGDSTMNTNLAYADISKEKKYFSLTQYFDPYKLSGPKC